MISEKTKVWIAKILHKRRHTTADGGDEANGVRVWLTTQSYNRIPLMVRKVANGLIAFKLKNVMLKSFSYMYPISYQSISYSCTCMYPMFTDGTPDFLNLARIERFTDFD
eukprot:SAG31_NODE_389_length_16370_cov_4.517915_14_plen_110_part_00